MTNSKDISTSNELNRLFSQRILVVDGATGTALERLKPSANDFGGEELVGCNEALNIHAPDLVDELHKRYIEAGSDLIKTNSFNGSRVVLDEYDLAGRTREIARLSAEIANRSIRRYAGKRPVFILGSMGPGTKSITVTGGITFDEVADIYHEYAAGLLEGGADILLLETMQDTLNLKAALLGIKAAQRKLSREAPLAVSVTIEAGGTMLTGQNIEALYHTLSRFDLFSLGLNCATGPAMMTDHLRMLAGMSRFPVSVWPNAGLPDENGNYTEGPEVFHDLIGRFAREGYINLAGGCCGTTPEHIRAICDAVKGVPPRQLVKNGQYPALAGAEPMVVETYNKPVFIGERTNTIGSKKFKRLIGAGKFDEAVEIGREQARKGAMALDLCTADPDRDEIFDFLSVLKPLLRKVRVPLLLDTIDSDVIKAALKTIGGKPAINSVNLEDGGERLRQIAAMAKEYGASLICGMIDDDPASGMAVTLERKLEIAERIYRILKDEFDLPDQDIILDPLVFPAGTGDPNYYGAAGETIKATRRFKEIYPDCLTILGISNVSFGLPKAGRDVLNSVFLYECTKAGLDMAIVNTQRLKRYPSIPIAEIRLAEDVLFKGDAEAISAFTNYFRDVKVTTEDDEWQNLGIAEKVSQAVVEARRTGLDDNLDALLKEMPPLAIINGPLMEGMDEVGRLFRSNRLIVAEVLESAEVMKVAVDRLRRYLGDEKGLHAKGKMVLATVRGDVHDIGKNLVDMILSNNGFEVVNLGIKVTTAAIIEAVKQNQPDMIGLSGLLVRSAEQMVHTAEDLSSEGIDIPLLVGGAALTKKFVADRIAPAYGGPVFYASEAMEGLNIANQIVDLDKLPGLIEKCKNEKEAIERRDKSAPTRKVIEIDVPEPPNLDPHILTSMPVDEIFGYTNPQMLYGKHLGVKDVTRKLKDGNDEKLNSLQVRVTEIFTEGVSEDVFAPKAVYRWFKVYPEGEQICVINPDDDKIERFDFPRQKSGGGLSAVDWIRSNDQGGDYICMFVVTSGSDPAVKASQMRGEDRLLDSHILQAAAIELTEASAEWLHRRLRSDWGFADPSGLTIKDLFKARYRGIRLSFGYPACPDIEQQAGLFRLLKPERIGVTLTEGYVMQPESSVSAVVFHHSK